MVEMSFGLRYVHSLLSVALNMEREDQEIYATYADAADNPGRSGFSSPWSR